MGLVRRVALVGVACVALAGCGAQAGGGALPADLRAWRFPSQLFIPQVEVPAPKPVPREHAPATEPRRTSRVSPGAPSDAEVRAQLEELYGAGAGDPGGAASVELERRVALDRGQAVAPPDAPAAVQRIVAAANQVARLPYVYGGGHGGPEGLFVDSAYDCSGSISFALANAGLMDRPMTSGEMMRWGSAGPGRWVTIYANAGHAFMVVGGARFDTVGLRETGSRWQQPPRSIRGFVARHPPGL